MDGVNPLSPLSQTFHNTKKDIPFLIFCLASREGDAILLNNHVRNLSYIYLLLYIKVQSVAPDPLNAYRNVDRGALSIKPQVQPYTKK